MLKSFPRSRVIDYSLITDFKLISDFKWITNFKLITDFILILNSFQPDYWPITDWLLADYYLADYLLADYWLIIGLLLANFEIVIKSFPENRKNNQTQKGNLLEIKNPAKVYGQIKQLKYLSECASILFDLI